VTTGDEESESLVDNLFREVDDQFKDLEREYSQAREDIASADFAKAPVDPLEASNERFELLSRVASLKAEIARQSHELDERDRMLAELGEKIASFQADIAERDATLAELNHMRQEAAAERREQARLAALLDARAAERDELVAAAQRIQNERDNVQELLTQALARFDDAELTRSEMEDKLRHLEAAQDSAAHQHESRAHELIESRAEMAKLADQLDEAQRQAKAEFTRAEKGEALAERRANESNYLNRRIEALTEKLDGATKFEAQAASLHSELNLAGRRIGDLERELASHQAEADAAQAAVAAVAERTADYDELAARVEQLEQERQSAAAAATAAAASVPIAAAAVVEQTPDELADRARELSGRRSIDQEILAVALEIADAEEPIVEPQSSTLVDLELTDLPVIDSDLARLQAANDAIEADVERLQAQSAEVERAHQRQVMADEIADANPIEAIPVPKIDDLLDEAAAARAGQPITTEIPAVVITEEPEIPEAEVPEPDVPQLDVPRVTAPVIDIPQAPVHEAPVYEAPVYEAPVYEAAPIETPGVGATRKRMVLPTDMTPNTPEAVTYLLNQPGVTAIVDARSTCGRTGIRPSELFQRVASLRDRFDVPVEVVVTPVSTPVGGAPSLPAVGVHHVTGADTVADRVRALCMGFPLDQPLVVIAGDDHVRRAAITQEANVVEPSAVIDLAQS